jgi:hypothetical protein
LGDRSSVLQPRAAATRLLALFLALGWLLGGRVTPAWPSTEEFSSFDVERVEEDDESFIDYLLAQPPTAWRDEWQRAPQAFRASQGCVTSGQWAMDNELKLVAPMGRRARFGLRLDQIQGDLLAYENLDLWFLFPQPVGTLGVMFRPFYDKSRQDFAVTWEAGADTSRNQLRLVYGLEDLFNNLWVWRQTRVGESGEPYDRHPWEPALKTALRREQWRFEAEGKWLTPSRRRIRDNYYAGTSQRVETLWGTWGTAALEARALGVTWVARTENRQASSTNQPIDLSSGDGRKTRRMWQAELGGRGALPGRIQLEARWVYADRMQSYRPPLADARFHGIDRTVQVEARWAWRPQLTVRLGGLYDRVGIGHLGLTGVESQGTRNESRAYFGLMARVGRVSLSGVEGIELDPEPYVVWHHHDKGFLLMQTTF